MKLSIYVCAGEGEDDSTWGKSWMSFEAGHLFIQSSNTSEILLLTRHWLPTVWKPFSAAALGPMAAEVLALLCSSDLPLPPLPRLLPQRGALGQPGCCALRERSEDRIAFRD